MMCKGACSINQIHTEAVDWGFHFSCLTGVQDEFLRSSHICAFTDVADTIIALCQGGGGGKSNWQEQKEPHNKPETSIQVRE